MGGVREMRGQLTARRDRLGTAWQLPNLGDNR
jgi:hypothetical protein